MTSANLQQWIQHPEMLNKDTLYELRTMLTRYPYFQTLRLLYLKNLYLLHDITFGAELRKATLYVADRRSLFYLIEGDKYILQSRKKKTTSVDELPEIEPNLDRTLALIDAFCLLYRKKLLLRPAWIIRRTIQLIYYRMMVFLLMMKPKHPNFVVLN